MAENYCTTKGLGYAFAIVAFFILVVPMGMTYAMVGLEDYMRYCNMTCCFCFGGGGGGEVARSFQKEFTFQSLKILVINILLIALLRVFLGL